MGWNAACLLVNEGGPGYFGSLPAHRPERAQTLLAQLYPGVRIVRVGDSNFNEEMSPHGPFFGLGVYDAGCILCDDELIGSTANLANPLLGRCLSLFPNASLIVLELAGVVNYFAYALYQGRTLRRAHVGDAEHGVTTDVGELLSEEVPYFHDSFVRDGRRILHVQGDEFDIAPAGETLAFDVAGRFLGAPLNEAPTDEMKMERFRRKWSLSNWWKRA
jgi:hypothetical protein